VAAVAEEVENPGYNIPYGMLWAFGVVTLLYVLVLFVTVGVCDPGQLSASLTPISLGAQQFLGSWGVTAIGIAAILAFVSTANAGILAAARNPMAMSRDRLLPAFLDKIHPRLKTPHNAIYATGAFILCAIVFLDLEGLVKTASTLKIILFMMVNISVLLMRESRIQNYQPTFESPLYPWMQIAGIAAYGILVVGMGRLPLAITVAFFAGGYLWFKFYVRDLGERGSALIHVVERIAGGDLTSNNLCVELKEILRERDNITVDRFDRLVSHCTILDVDGSPTMEELFEQVAGALEDELATPRDELYSLLLDRERDTSTALTATLAVPHVVIEGCEKFSILIARCKEGILFSEQAPSVHAIFVLAGSVDERRFHLRALMAIAQLVQAQDFQSKWLAARSTEALQDLILLGKRTRHDD